MGSFRIALICVGDELLDGRTADRNAHFVGRRATERGWGLEHVRVVPDVLAEIARAVTELVDPARLLVVSGGLGPTSDDLTRDAVASAAGVPLVEDADALARLRGRFTSRGRTMGPSNVRQAWFPAGATVHPSEVGTAAPFSVTVRGGTVLCLPGVPAEFQALLDALAPAYLGDATPGPRTQLHLLGIGESTVGERVDALGLSGVEIAYSARFPYVVLTLRGTDGALVESGTRAAAAALAPWLVPRGAPTLPEAVADLCRARGWRVATAESCTGGAIASALTDLPGSSAWFDRGWVTYANEAKQDALGVPSEVLERHGAVSPQTVRAMARGALERSRGDVAVAVSGIAGPGGGSPDRPVGLVYLGVATRDAGVVVRARFGGTSRGAFKRATTALALLALVRSAEGEADTLSAIWGVDWTRPFEEIPD